MLRFVYFVGNNLPIDCDPTKYSQKGHGGYVANDPIDDTKVNVKYEVVRRENSNMYEDFVHLYITKSSWDETGNGNELYLSYGIHYWLFRRFRDNLSASDKSEAEKLAI